MRPTVWLTLVLACLVWRAPAFAQNADRTIEEIKTETLARAQTGAYPTLGIAPDDARDALGHAQRVDEPLPRARHGTAQRFERIVDGEGLRVLHEDGGLGAF